MEKLPVIVTSNIKKSVRAAKDMNTSAEVIEVLNKRVHESLEKAMENAIADGRKTVMARDFKEITL